MTQETPMRHKPQPFLFDQYLSFVDLEKLDDWHLAWKGQDKQKFEEILYNNGADLEFGWSVVEGLHRPRTSNQVDYGPRVTFKERSDKWWVRNMMSVEDIITHVTDEQVRVDLIGMMNQKMSLSEAIEDALGKYTVSEVEEVLKGSEEPEDEDIKNA